jgi:hypothetical protein
MVHKRRQRDSADVMQIRVLQQLTQWVMMHPERFRDKMEEQRDIDQTTWVSSFARTSHNLA